MTTEPDGNDRGITPTRAAAMAELDDEIRKRTSALAPGLEGSTLEDDYVVTGTPILTEWVLLAVWTDEEGLTHTNCITSPNLPWFHVMGLASEVLRE